MKINQLTLAAAIAVSAAPAMADDDDLVSDPGESPGEQLRGDKALVTDYGAYGLVGGGVNNFTEPSTMGTTSVGGYWDARVGFGSRSIFGGEVGYLGGARDVDAIGLSSGAFMLNNGVEGVGRLNIPITGVGDKSSLIEPYTFGGVGWQYFSLANVSTNTSDVDNDDHTLTIPMGVGLALGYGGVTLDSRIAYRPVLFSDMMGYSTNSFDSNAISFWTAGASIGYEF